MVFPLKTSRQNWMKKMSIHIFHFVSPPFLREPPTIQGKSFPDIGEWCGKFLTLNCQLEKHREPAKFSTESNNILPFPLVYKWAIQFSRSYSKGRKEKRNSNLMFVELVMISNFSSSIPFPCVLFFFSYVPFFHFLRSSFSCSFFRLFSRSPFSNLSFETKAIKRSIRKRAGRSMFPSDPKVPSRRYWKGK